MKIILTKSTKRSRINLQIQNENNSNKIHDLKTNYGLLILFIENYLLNKRGTYD